MKLRSHLILLAFGTIVPVAIFAAGAAAWLVDKERETVLAAAEQRSQTLLTALEAELRGHVAALEGLAAHPSLEDGDVAYFRRAIANAITSHRGWLNVSLILPDGRIAADGISADGVPPGKAALETVMRTRRSQIGAVALHPTLQKWQFPIYAPVVQAGTVRYVVAAYVSTASVDELIGIQRLGEGWVAAVLDGDNRFVSRNRGAAKYVGTPAAQSLQDALRESPSGIFRGRTVEGIDVYSPYHRSKATGWAVAMGIPSKEIDDASNRTAWLLLSGVLLSISLAMAGAYVISRRIATPLMSLAGAAEAIGQGQMAEIPQHAQVDEIRTLATVLQASARAAHEREDALRDADRAKDRFLAMLSHELRNPLASISAASHVLKVARPDSANAVKARLVIERQTRHMAHLINDLLDISRVTIGKMALDRERLDLGELVARVISVWRSSGRFERHEVALDLLHKVWVHGDRVRLEQVVNNLLDNALKFTSIGKGIRVRVAQEEGEAVLQVADEGAGIPPALLAELFKPFVQGSEPGAHAAAGLGIGLSLVKGLVEMHGGMVSAANDEKRGGAVFTVRLPAVPAQAANDEPESVVLGGRRILIIEDDDDTRSMLHAAFELGGHHVRNARDGTTGLAIAAESPPDVAIIDIGLPDMDGIEVARRLRAGSCSRRINLVALTGFGGSEDQRRALEAGFDVHLTKPVTQERLKRVIGDLK